MPLLIAIAHIIGVVLPAVSAVRIALPSHTAAASTDPLTGLLQKIETLLGLVTGEQWQDMNTLEGAVTDVTQAMGVLTSGGILAGNALDEVSGALAKIQFASDLLASKPVTIAVKAMLISGNNVDFTPGNVDITLSNGQAFAIPFPAQPITLPAIGTVDVSAGQDSIILQKRS